MITGYNYIAPLYRRVQFDCPDTDKKISRGDIVPVPKDAQVLGTYNFKALEVKVGRGTSRWILIHAPSGIEKALVISR